MTERLACPFYESGAFETVSSEVRQLQAQLLKAADPYSVSFHHRPAGDVNSLGSPRVVLCRHSCILAQRTLTSSEALLTVHR